MKRATSRFTTNTTTAPNGTTPTGDRSTITHLVVLAVESKPTFPKESGSVVYKHASFS